MSEITGVTITMNMLNHTAWLLSCGNVQMQLQHAEHDPIGFRAKQQGLISEAQLEYLTNKIGRKMPGTKLVLSVDDLLLLFTVVELNARFLLSDQGHEFLEQMQENHILDPKRNGMSANGYNELLKLSGVFAQKCMAAMEEVPAFKERKEQLDLLNEWL